MAEIDRRIPVVGDTLRVLRRPLNSDRTLVLGHAGLTTRGWLFIPAIAGRKPSRKAHKTLAGCLPRWVGYPDRCHVFGFIGGFVLVVALVAAGALAVRLASALWWWL